ncbi:cupin domain-containing protein [Rhizobium sp. BK068]|uniref:cupin domain-containing protein n=1 Tax=Rhizobium sp. BK068 TaxID=2512130 RepID=UPI00247AE071|nr:cupin domain-containing protein [Rhizobium sp. BK068]
MRASHHDEVRATGEPRPPWRKAFHRWIVSRGPPLHVHHREDAVFHLLEGEMRLQIGDRNVHAGAGQTLVAPKGIPHSFRIESAAGAHCLTITRGDDFETMLRQASRIADKPELPAATAPSPEMIDALTRCCAENNIAIVGPPLA